MSASQTLESYLASFRRHKPLPLARAYVPASRPKPSAAETDSLSVSTISSIDTEMLLRSDTSEIVVKQAHRPQVRTKANHRKNVHSLPLSIIQENSEVASRAYFHYDIHDYLPQSGARKESRKAVYRKPQVRNQTEVARKQKLCPGKKQTVDKQSTVSSVDTDALLQSSEDEFDGENFPISHFTRELLEKRPACRPDSSGSISPRYNPLVSIGSTSRASPLPPNPRKDADIQMPLISPSPDLTTHTRTMSMPISPVRGRKLSEAAMVMVENNKQVFLCPSERSEEKASLESTLQKCLAAQRNCFQDQRPSPSGNVSVTPKFSTKPNLRIRHPFEQSSSSGREGNSQRASETSSDPSEAFEAFCREQSQKAGESGAPGRASPRRKGARTYIKLKVCTCILSGLINSHKPGCRVTTVTALLPTSDSNNSSFASLCNLKSGTTHSHMHTTGSRSAFDASVREETKRKRQLSIVEAVVMIQRKVREFLKRRKDAVSLAYSRSTNDRSAANTDIERATQSIYSAIGHLQELKSSQRNQGMLSLGELTVSGPQTDADLLDLSSEQFGRVIRQGELHAAAQSSWSDFLQRESGETLWIDASASSIEGLGTLEIDREQSRMNNHQFLYESTQVVIAIPVSSAFLPSTPLRYSLNMRSERQCSTVGKSQVALSTLDALLRREDASIEDVLNSGEALLAARKGHPPLLNFDLIDCLIDDPFPEIDGRNASLYPFIACEMLTESPAVLDLFFTDHIYLDQLFSFLQKDYLNDTSAAYFATVAMNLLDRNAEELIGYLFVKYDYGMDIVRHIDTRAVHDFLLKLIHCDSPVSQFSLDKLYLLDAMCLCIAPDSLDECILNASHVLTDLISNCHDMKGWRVYMAMIMKEKTVAAWCRLAVSSREVLSLTVVKLLTAIANLPDFESISRINYDDVDRAIRKQLGKPYNPAPVTVTISSLPPILAHLLPLLPTLVDFLKPACSPLFTGRVSQLRIAIVELVSALSKISLYEVTEALVETHAISVIVMLFQAQPWASFLHTAFERLVGVIAEGGNMTLRKELIGEAKLMLVLAEIAQNSEEVTEKGRRRKGFMGHVTKISNYLLNSDCVRDLVAPFSSHPDWLSYQSSYLFPRSSLENTKLGTESAIGLPFQEVTNTVTERDKGRSRGKTVEIPEVSLEKQIGDQPTSPPLYSVPLEFPSGFPDPRFYSFAYWRLSPVPSSDLPPLD